MSDALTDITRDSRKSTAIGRYLETLLEYLRDRKTQQELMKAAEESDGMSGGWSERTRFSSNDHCLLVESLRKGDALSWAKFMSKLRDPILFQQFKEVSPFNGKLLLKVECGPDGTATVSGPDVLCLIAPLIGDGTKEVYNKGYVVTLDPTVARSTTGVLEL